MHKPPAAGGLAVIEGRGGSQEQALSGGLADGAGGLTLGPSWLKPSLQALRQGTGGSRSGPSPRSPHSGEKDSDTGSRSWGRSEL